MASSLIFHGHNVVSAVSESERKPPNAKSANAWRIVDTICGSAIESDVEDATVVRQPEGLDEEGDVTRGLRVEHKLV